MSLDVRRRIQMRIGRFLFTVALHEEEAPKTCAAILSVLPITGKVIHARWSGEAVWLPMDRFRIQIGLENATSHPSRGDLLFYPGFISEKEMLIPYGSTCFASKVGQLEGNHFASIVDGVERLGEMGQKVLWEGAQRIRIEPL